MWSVRLSLLCVLGRYREAEEEMHAFGELDYPDLCYQYNRHNYPGKVGRSVAILFSAKLLLFLLGFHSRKHGSFLHAYLAC